MPGYQVNDQLCPYFVETKIAGSDPGQATSLVCAYEGRPVVMVYTWELGPPVVELIKKLDETAEKHKEKRLAGYVVLLSENEERAKELKALAQKERIQDVLLTLVVINQTRIKDEKAGPGLRQFLARFGKGAETRVYMANGQKQVKASFAFHKGELNRTRIDELSAALPTILPNNDG